MDVLLDFVRAHRWPVVSALCVVVLASGFVGAAYAYDSSQAEVIAAGVHVGKLDLGGLTPAVARHRLRRAYRPLQRPLVLRAGKERFVLTPRAAHLVFHVDQAVSKAIARGRGGWFLTRAVRELAGHDVNARVAPPITFSTAAVDRFVHRVQAKIEQTRRNARLQPSADRLVIVRGRDGIVVDGAMLWRNVRNALVSVDAGRVLPVPRTYRTPAMTVARLRRRFSSYITVDREHFQLRVYQDLKPVRTYSIAVGQIGLETPAGLYHVQNKQVDPSWAVPRSTWAGSLAGAVIPPGPDDPLKARWLGIFAGAGIHGTEDTGSIGSAASHGCIRMTIPDVIDLYDRVDVGTPIYID
jgi:lipoprotein-anchoring transpeptidase ErfK/SrfK